MTEKSKSLQLDSTAAKPNEKLKSYSSPKLKFYGYVRNLTQGGSFAPSSDANTGMMGACERRLKENIREIGRHPLGFGLYLFNYKPEFHKIGGCGRQFGVMVDEVEKVIPEAVSTNPEGYKMVNYALLGISPVTN